MRKKEYSVLPVVLAMTLVLIVCAVLFRDVQKKVEEEEADPWQLASGEAALSRPEGLSGILFSSDRALKTDGGWFGLVRDKDSGILYAYVPAEMNGPLHVFFEGKTDLQIEGDGVSGTFSSGDELPLFAEGKEYTFSFDGTAGGENGAEAAGLVADDGNTANGENGAEGAGGEDSEDKRGTVVFLYSENVPSMYIDTQSGSMEAIDGDKKHQTEETASYRIFQTDGAQDASGTCVIKGRGNSTWSQKKKPYNLKLDNENSLLGMDSCTKLALVANFWDSSQTRQYYAFEMAERLGLAYTPQTRLVNVYLNGNYHSLCLLTQRLNVNGGTVKITDLDEENEKANRGESDPQMVVMDSDEDGNQAFAYAYRKEPRDITGGYLIEFENRYEKEDLWFASEARHFVFKSPQTPSVGEYEYMSDYVREAEKALFAGAVVNDKGEAAEDVIDETDGVNPDTGKNLWEYFDMDSWARMYLVQDFTVQSDDEYYSFFFYKEAGDPLLYCGPAWDFDLCLGNMNCGDYYRTSAQTLWLRDGRKRWLHRMDQFPEFRERVAQIFLEEFEPIIRDIMENEFDQNVDLLEKDTNLNYLRWGKNLVYRDRVGLVRTLIKDRLEFMHDYYSDPDSYCRLLFHFAWDDFSYYVKRGESMGFIPTAEYGEKQSDSQREGNGFIIGWQDPQNGELLQADTVITRDREFDPVYE